MLIDAVELRLQCKDCGTKYKHIIGYGPVCPNELLRQQMLRQYPPHCPKCGCSNFKRLSLWGSLMDLFSWNLTSRAPQKSTRSLLPHSHHPLRSKIVLLHHSWYPLCFWVLPSVLCCKISASHVRGWASISEDKNIILWRSASSALRFRSAPNPHALDIQLLSSILKIAPNSNSSAPRVRLHQIFHQITSKNIVLKGTILVLIWHDCLKPCSWVNIL